MIKLNFTDIFGNISYDKKNNFEKLSIESFQFNFFKNNFEKLSIDSFQFNFNFFNNLLKKHNVSFKITFKCQTIFRK